MLPDQIEPSDCRSQSSGSKRIAHHSYRRQGNTLQERREPHFCFGNAMVGIRPMLATYSLCKTRASRLGKLNVDQVEIKSTQENLGEALGNTVRSQADPRRRQARESY